MDNMNTMDFNQKIDVSLRASLEATPVERNASDDLSTGSSSDGFWDLIVLYTGSPQTLQNEFPSSSFTFLLGNYANAVQRAPALLDVADDAAQDAHIGVGVHKDLHVH